MQYHASSICTCNYLILLQLETFVSHTREVTSGPEGVPGNGLNHVKISFLFTAISRYETPQGTDPAP